jgi:hypothetical protein
MKHCHTNGARFKRVAGSDATVRKQSRDWQRLYFAFNPTVLKRLDDYDWKIGPGCSGLMLYASIKPTKKKNQSKSGKWDGFINKLIVYWST